MKTLQQICVPRQSAVDPQSRDTVNPVLGRAADGAVVPGYFRRAAGTLFSGLGIAEGPAAEEW